MVRCPACGKTPVAAHPPSEFWCSPGCQQAWQARQADRADTTTLPRVDGMDCHYSATGPAMSKAAVAQLTPALRWLDVRVEV